MTTDIERVVIFFDLGDTLVDSTGAWIPGAQKVLDDLERRGVALGIISNTGALDRQSLRTRLPDDFDFDLFEPALIILSSEVGVEKPSPEVFQFAKQRSGTALAVFCTEDHVHSLAAQREGLLVVRTAAPPYSDIKSVPAILQGAGIVTPAP